MSETKPKENLYQILKKVATTRNKENKVKNLQKLNSLAALNILKGAFDESVKWDLPSGKPPTYDKETNEDGTPTKTLEEHSEVLGKLVDHPANRGIPRVKKEVMFLNLIAGLDSEEEFLVIQMKDKKFPFKGITKETVEKAFPNLIKL